MKYLPVIALILSAVFPFAIIRADTTLEPAPVFDPSTQVQMFKDDFDTYTTFADTVLNGWRCTNHTTTQDVTTNPLGACQIVSGGYDNTGKAMRLVYDGISQGSNQEGHSWAVQMKDPLAAMPGYAFYMQFYFRINPGGGFTLDQDYTRGVQIKWLELYNLADNDRAQFSTGYQTCGRSGGQKYGLLPEGSGTFWRWYGNAGGNTDCNAAQIRPPFIKDSAPGSWHVATYKYVTQSPGSFPNYAHVGGARDGIAQMWLDGTLVLSVNSSDCGQPVPEGIPIGTINPPHWCENEDLDNMYVQGGLGWVVLGSVMTNGHLWPFSIDYDHMSMWRDNGSTPVPPITPPADTTPPVIPPPDNGGTILTSPITTPSPLDTTQTSVTPPPSDPLAAVIALILDNRPLFEKATSLGITLPPLIQKVLDTGSLTQADLDGTTSVQLTTPTKTTTAPVTSTPTSHTNLSLSSITRPLKLNYLGTDVILLQNFLIQTNAGPQAKLLATHGANGSFGPLTQAALMEYQKSVGIPQTGVVDAGTKARTK